jgi:hypothetical protein
LTQQLLLPLAPSNLLLRLKLLRVLTPTGQ